MTEDTYIRLDSVSKKYKNFLAVDNLSMTVNKGDIYGFLGPNGAGKSTSIRMILSLISPSKGRIELFNQDLRNNRYKTLSRIGALIEKPDFYNYLTARQNLKILGKISSVQNLDHKIDETLDLVGLLERADSKVKAYSQGMRQRLGIAQTLLHDPDLIILDEPANGLDPKGQKEMRELIKYINQEKHVTILISSHILNEIELISNRMIIINKGKKIVEGTVHELLEEGDLKVKIETDKREETKRIISESEFRNLIDDESNYDFTLKIENDQIPKINNLLVNKGINVYSIKPVRSLEEYFINITNS